MRVLHLPEIWMPHERARSFSTVRCAPCSYLNPCYQISTSVLMYVLL